MNELIKDLQRRIETLEKEQEKRRVQQLLFPLDEISKKIIGGLSMTSSSKSASSENQSVNEGGSATYSVLAPPDGFAQTTLTGTTTTIYLPYFT